MSDRHSRIVVSAGAGRQLLAAAEWLHEHAAAQQVLVLAPTRGAADDLLRACLQPGEGLFGVHRMTPRQLVANAATAALAERGRAPVAGMGVEALAARAVASCRSAGELRYFEPVAEFPGFPRALARTLDELRMAALSAERVAGAGDPGADLARLERAYETTLEEFALADDAELWRLAAAAVAAGECPLAGMPLLLLDAAPTTAREAELYGALAAASPDVLATLTAGDDEALAMLAKCLGAAPDPELEAPGAAAEHRLERLRRSVFRDVAPAAPAPEEDDTVEFVSAPGEGRECVEIARRIVRLAAEGIRFDRIAVLLRHPEGYLGLIEEALRRADVPVYFTRGTVRPHASGRAFLALLACRAEHLSASRFAEYLSLGQVPVRDAGGRPSMVEVPWVEPDGVQLVFKSLLSADAAAAKAVHPAPGPRPVPDGGSGAVAPEDDRPGDASAAEDEPAVPAGTLPAPRRWEQMLVDAAVVGGLDRWKRRLRGLQSEYRLRLQALDDNDSTQRAHLERQLRGLARLEAFALPVVEILDALPGEARWGEWLERLRELAVLTLRRPEKVLAALAELDPMDQVGPVGLGEVRRALEARLTFLRVEPGDRRYGRVLVATIDEARGRAFHTVFVPGLAEGIFPRRATEDPLLLDEHRRSLDPRLATQEARIERERQRLRVAAGAAERRLVVSYPTLDALQGRARVPSFYALDVARAAEGRLPDLDDLERRAATASASMLGWPAPRAASLAIDAAEYDVASLAALLTRARSPARGRARFLLEANEHLARALRARALRWRPRFSFADGLVAPDDRAAVALQEHRLAARSYSPTALQKYAVCPYQFLLYAIHRLRPREEPVPLERMDPLTRGSLFHQVQYELLVRLRELGALPIDSGGRAAATQLADGVLDEVAGAYAEELAPAIPRVWRDEIEGIRTDLRGWIRAVAERDHDWTPTYFEFAFGLGRQAGRDPLSQRQEAVVADGYRLRGSIDLVERDARRDVWRVTDHKTGRALRERYAVVGHGEVLQPLLYALAVEYHLGNTVESGRLFYCTRRGDYETREVPLNAETRTKAAQVLGLVDGAIREGFLPAAPRERACDWCDFRAVCGPYEEIRIRRKDRGLLAGLELLRRAP